MISPRHDHLLYEDRAKYERILDEALRAAPRRPELAAVGQRLSAEHLRTMALNATPLITAAAATEYQHYVRLREELRDSASAPAPSDPPRSDTGPAGPVRRFGAAVLGAGRSAGRGTGGDGVAAHRWNGMSYGRRLLAALLGLRVRPEKPTAAARAPRTSEPPMALRTSARPGTVGYGAPASQETGAAGAGVFAVFAVLVPLLSGTAAAIFLLVGFALKAFGAEPSLARYMITAGWLFGAVTMCAVLVCAVVLVLTALRSRGRPARKAEHQKLSEELARAEEAWREAVLERGIVPFLRDALADPVRASSLSNASSAPTGRVPGLGYDRPGLTTPSDDPGPAPRPSYTSPDRIGPEHRQD